MATIDHLDWDDLKVLLSAGRNQTLAGAARALKVDQSTVSRRISSLEHALGSALFERHKSGLVPTEAGSVALRHAEWIEGGVIGLREALGGEAGEAGGAVRIATMEGIASLYIASRLSALRLTHPQIRVELVTSSQLVHVSRREADVFLSFFEHSGKGILSRRVGKFRLMLFASRAYLQARPAIREPADLSAHDFVTYIDDLLHMDTVRWLDEVVREPRVVFTSSSMIAQMHAACGGMGIVLLPIFALEGANDLVPVLPGDIRVERDLWLHVHRDLEAVPRVRALVQFLCARFEADQVYLNGPGEKRGR